MAAMSSIKMDELLVSWLGNDDVYESVMELIENYRQAEAARLITEQLNDLQISENTDNEGDSHLNEEGKAADENESKPAPSKDDKDNDEDSQSSPRTVIPPFYPAAGPGRVRRRRRSPVTQYDTWEPIDSAAAGGGGTVQDGGDGGSSVAVRSFNREDVLGQQMQQQRQQESAEAVDVLTVDQGNGSIHSITGTGMFPNASGNGNRILCARDLAQAVFLELGQDPPMTSPVSVDSSFRDDDDDEEGENTKNTDKDKEDTNPDEPVNSSLVLIKSRQMERLALSRKYLTPENFIRITKEVCRFPSFFNAPLYQRILELYNRSQPENVAPMEVISYDILAWYWIAEMEPYDPCDRFFRLVKQPDSSVDCIVRDDFLPFIKALLQDHPGLEFLSSHAEFQEKYAVTVITRIFYSVNRCHSGRISSRQIRRSDLLEAFQQVDEEEDINKVTRYFSYEHFYVLYCRFWELDHDRDYRITREDLLKYGDHSLSHMIVDRIFDAAPRPFEQENPNREYLSYEDFIYFMLSEEDKSNEVSVRYWFACVDVDGDGKLNNMEMRSFYAVQLHRMQCMGHEIVPFEDMLCQMMDMIKPSQPDHLIAEDFLQPECCQVSGALFDALFNLNKYLLFEQRDPFAERQKREDEFDCDWDRFACIDYNRLAMEEEAREEEAMEIDWVTVDDDEDADAADGFAGGQQQQQQQQAMQQQQAGGGGGGTSEAPF